MIESGLFVFYFVVYFVASFYRETLQKKILIGIKSRWKYYSPFHVIIIDSMTTMKINGNINNKKSQRHSGNLIKIKSWKKTQYGWIKVNTWQAPNLWSRAHICPIRVGPAAKIPGASLDLGAFNGTGSRPSHKTFPRNRLVTMKNREWVRLGCILIGQIRPLHMHQQKKNKHEYKLRILEVYNNLS